jgi:hypothetical protein
MTVTFHAIPDGLPPPRQPPGSPADRSAFDAAVTQAKQGPPQPTAPAVSPDRQKQIDNWLVHDAGNDFGSGYLPWADNGGDKVADALHGHSSLGELSHEEQQYLIDRSAAKWVRENDTSSASTLARDVAGDRNLGTMVELADARQAASVEDRGPRDPYKRIEASAFAHDALEAAGKSPLAEASADDLQHLKQLLPPDQYASVAAALSTNGATPAEIKLQEQNRAALSHDPAASAAYEKLLNDNQYKSLSPDARLALLSQIRNYPDARSIANLQRLAGRAWFRGDSSANQQRDARLIAFASQDPKADPKINADTLNHLLGDDGISLQWAGNAPSDGAEHDNHFLFWKTGETITLNSNAVQAGNGPPSGNDDALRQVSETALRFSVAAALSKDGATPAELRLEEENRTALAGNPAAAAAYDRLLHDDKYRSLGPDARFAILSQVKNYPDARSIANLERLAGRDWFRGDSLANQQRDAKMIAFTSQDQTGDTVINNNTLKHVLGDGNLDIKWAAISAPPGTVTYGEQSDNHFLFWKTGSTITLNQNFIAAGNGPLTGNLTAVKLISEDTLSHEVNHDLNHDENNASYRYFMAEYRAWYVGREAALGHPPSQQDCYARAQFLVTSTQGAYASIGDAFRNSHSGDSKDIVRFMAKILGQDPARATPQSVLAPNPTLDPSRPGQIPEKSGSDDPVNLDNH